METNQKPQKKQKVLIVHNYYQIPGGEDTVVANEKKLLEDHGHKVLLYTRNNNELKNMSILGKILLPFSAIYNLRTAVDIKKIIREEKIDIVHVHNTLSLISPAVYYAAVKCGVPVVQTIHNFRFLCPGATFYRDGHICEDCVEKGLWCAVKHKCYRRSRIQTLVCVISTWIHRHTGILQKINYICLTEFNKEKLFLLNREKLVIDPQKVFIKPNFTFEEDYKDISGSSEEDGKYYLFIGRIEEIKGVSLLLNVFSRLHDKKLRLAGIGSEFEKCKHKATDNITFLGFLNREQITKQLKGARAILVPSQWYETFGLVIVEAYAAHKPVLVGDIGNIASLVEDGTTGLKFQYNNEDAFYDAMNHFECMQSMNENAYRKYQREFSPEINYRKLLAVYEAIKIQ